MALPMLFNSCKSSNVTRLFIYSTIKRYSQNADKSLQPTYKSEKTTKIRFYLLDKYSLYLRKYEKILEKQLPGAMRIYRIFMDGIKYFYQDFKDFIRIFRMVNLGGKDLKALTLKEIELYDQMPKDMIKVAPVLLISALPFANYVIFPLAYYFPKHLLCRHFWNLQQKSEFRIEYLRKRLLHNRPVFRHLQLQLPNLRAHPLHKKWSNVLGQIGSGVHPSVMEILECKELFSGEPYHINFMSGNHIKHLIKMYELHMGFLRRIRLTEKAAIIQAMDMAILKEGGVDKLGGESLKNACFIRGYNPTNVAEDDMKKWLMDWISISKEIEPECYSLLLHCPILIGYNQPNNWRLIYPVKVNI